MRQFLLLILTSIRVLAGQRDASDLEPRIDLRDFLEHVGDGVQFKIRKDSFQSSHARGDLENSLKQSAVSAVMKAVRHIKGCREPSRVFPYAGPVPFPKSFCFQ